MVRGKRTHTNITSTRGRREEGEESGAQESTQSTQRKQQEMQLVEHSRRPPLPAWSVLSQWGNSSTRPLNDGTDLRVQCASWPSMDGKHAPTADNTCTLFAFNGPAKLSLQTASA